MNNVTIMGRLVYDPEMRQTQTGKNVTTFTVACDKQGGADFVPCVAWEQTGEQIARYFRKGQRILLSGSLASRDWTTKNGEKRTWYAVNVTRWEFIERKEEGSKETTAAPDMTPLDDNTVLPF